MAGHLRLQEIDSTPPPLLCSVIQTWKVNNKLTSSVVCVLLHCYFQKYPPSSKRGALSGGSLRLRGEHCVFCCKASQKAAGGRQKKKPHTLTHTPKAEEQPSSFSTSNTLFSARLGDLELTVHQGRQVANWRFITHFMEDYQLPHPNMFLFFNLKLRASIVNKCTGTWIGNLVFKSTVIHKAYRDVLDASSCHPTNIYCT